MEIAIFYGIVGFLTFLVTTRLMYSEAQGLFDELALSVAIGALAGVCWPMTICGYIVTRGVR